MARVLAKLFEQVDQLAVVLGRLGDDELALEFAKSADRAAIVFPTVGGDGVLDQLGDRIDQFLAGRARVALLAAGGSRSEKSCW